MDAHRMVFTALDLAALSLGDLGRVEESVFAVNGSTIQVDTITQPRSQNTSSYSETSSC
jgi:hypothetical protein